MSLDGYIADSKGGVGWLEGQGSDNENIDAYSAFIKNIDTILMGWNTYHQIVTELSPTEWICGGTNLVKFGVCMPFVFIYKNDEPPHQSYEIFRET